MPVSAADLQLLAQYDTPTISNVIELFEVRPRSAGYMDARIRACFPEMPPIVGYASTATMRTSWPRGQGDVYSGLDEQVAHFAELPGPAIVVFQDLDDPPAAATFGEVMCTTYKAFGAAGLITSGAGRDLDQVEAIGFPCFTSGAICAHGYCHFVEIGTPVEVGGIRVQPGDLLHGDRNGVTTIPHAIAEAVASACPEFMEAEAVVLDYLRAGRPDPQKHIAARNESRDRIEALARRLKG